MGLSLKLKIPTLGERPRGGWTQKAPAPTRLKAKVEKQKDDAAAERKAKAAVWLLDKGHCRCCGRKVERKPDMLPDRAEFHHVNGRTVKAIRWDVRNLILLCLECHQQVTGVINLKVVLVATAQFVVKGESYKNGRKAVRFERVA
jgi:hypothetical protein